MSYPPAAPQQPAPQPAAVPQAHPGQPGAAAYQAPVPQHSSPTTMASTNAFAMLSLVLSFLVPVAGVVLGHIALGQIRRNGDSGRGLALAGVIIGYAYVAMIAMFVIAYIGMIVVMFASFGAAMGEFGNGYSSRW